MQTETSTLLSFKRDRKKKSTIVGSSRKEISMMTSEIYRLNKKNNPIKKMSKQE